MTSRPEGPKAYSGPVILPGAATGAVPVDVNDPTKGVVTPVATAIELTQGVTELFQAVNLLDAHLSMLGRAVQDGFADIGTLIEALIHDMSHEIGGGDLGGNDWLSPAVQEFLDARVKAREAADAAAAEEAEALKAQAEADEALAAKDDFPDGGMRGED